MTVERHRADRPSSPADQAAFKEGVIEVAETVEELVIEKRARVVEEVVIHKEAKDHVSNSNFGLREGLRVANRLRLG